MDNCKEKCCTLNSCLGMCSLKTGVLLVGGFSVVCYVGVFFTVLVLSVTEDYMNIQMFFLLLSALIITVSSSLMIYGVHGESRGLIRQWVVLQIVMMFIIGLALSVVAYYLMLIGKDVLGTGVIVICVLFLLVYMYCVLVAANYCLKLQENTSDISDERQSSNESSI